MKRIQPKFVPKYVLYMRPVIEVVDVDHEGEVGEGAQHEGGDKAGGDVVAGLPHKVDDHLVETFSMFFNIISPFLCLCSLQHQRWCSCWRETPQQTLFPCTQSSQAWSAPAIINLGDEFNMSIKPGPWSRSSSWTRVRSFVGQRGTCEGRSCKGTGRTTL